MAKAHHHSEHHFEVRGPLTLAQFEKELRESYLEPFELKQKVYGKTEESMKARIVRRCDRVRPLSREGDELCFFTSESKSQAELAGTDGYVLIRKNEVVDLMVRCIN